MPTSEEARKAVREYLALADTRFEAGENDGGSALLYKGAARAIERLAEI